MYRDDYLLFYEGELAETLRNCQNQINSKVDQIHKDQLFATPEDDLILHVSAIMEVEPITLHEDSAEMEQDETKIDVSGYRERNPFHDRGPINVPGIRVVVSIPYTGDHMLWKLKPNKWTSVFPRAKVSQGGRNAVGQIEIVVEQPSDESQEKIKQRIESELESIRFYLESQREQIQQYNAGLSTIIRQAIQIRKERVKKNEGIIDLLGIPLKRRGDAPSVEPIAIQRRLIRPLPPPTKSGYIPEPGITEADYEHILSVIRHEGRTFEATPKTYAVHDEEELRDIMLAHLNGHYQGGATGETFRLSGKTDIRIEDNNRAAFVAECKIWRGAKELTFAVDQLLGYLTWRDCKAAIVVFNKNNSKFSELLSKIPEVLRSHPRFKKDLGQKMEGEWRFVMRSLEDEFRQVIVNIFAFNIYVG